MDFEEETHFDIVCISSGSEYFDEVIGHIEDIVMSQKFQSLQEAFLEKHWQTFENTDENKLEYTTVFNEYTTLFESFFVDELKQRMHHFDVQRFADDLKKNNELEGTFSHGEIYELLQTFSNFRAFKELMLDYRAKKEGATQHLDLDILVTKPLFIGKLMEVDTKKAARCKEAKPTSTKKPTRNWR